MPLQYDGELVVEVRLALLLKLFLGNIEHCFADRDLNRSLQTSRYGLGDVPRDAEGGMTIFV